MLSTKKKTLLLPLLLMVTAAGALQAQEKTGRGLLISLLSGSVLLVVSLFILVRIAGAGGIWYSWVMAQIAALIVSALLYIRERRKMIDPA